MTAVNSLFSQRPWSDDAGFRFPRSLGLGGGEEAHVLAVDDSIVDRKVIEKLLKIYSCKVTAVDSVKRALQFLGLDEEVTERATSAVQRLKVDLIITDYSMPELTGYELLKKIKESSSFRDIPVVIMSSENVIARIDRCLEEGAEDFIVKPVKLSDMERLKQHLAAKDVSGSSKLRPLSHKRKQPDAPDLSSFPTSSESTPSLASPSSLSPVSSPSSASPESSSLLSASPESSSLLSASPESSSLLSASPESSPVSPDLTPPVIEPLDPACIKLKPTNSAVEIFSDSLL